MNYIQVKNWGKFQHYKKRNPPWIKLHAELLSDYAFSRLQDASKLHLMMIWLLASRTANKLPNDPGWLQKQIGAETKPNINLLIEMGFIEEKEGGKRIASMLPSGCISQTEAEAEAETEKTHTQLSENHDKTPLPKRDPCPFQQIVALYHEKLPALPHVEKLTNTRKGFIRQRWKQDLPDLAHWENYFLWVAESSFLMGQATPRNGSPPFIADLEWLTRPGNFAKVAEDKYHRV